MATTKPPPRPSPKDWHCIHRPKGMETRPLVRSILAAHGGTFTVWFSGTRAACRRWILGRARGHMPPYYAITSRTSDFDKCF